VGTSQESGSGTLRETCELILRIGSLAHQLQKERGVSAIAAASPAADIVSTMKLLRIQSDKSLDELETFEREATSVAMRVEDYLKKGDTMGKINALEGVLQRRASFDTLKEVAQLSRLRSLLLQVRLTAVKRAPYSEVVSFYSELLHALIGVIAEMLAEIKAHRVGPMVAAYLAFLYLKESVGVERALVGGMLAAKEHFIQSSYSDLVSNWGEQKANNRTFKMNAPSNVLKLYNLMNLSFSDEVMDVDQQLRLYKESGEGKPLSETLKDIDSMQWFEKMTHRIDKLSTIEAMLANKILELGMQSDEFEINSNNLHLDNSHHGESNPLVPTLSAHYLIDIRELDIKQEIGRGTTGSTYLALWRGTKCAVKVMQVQKEGADRDMLLKDFGREVSVLNKAHHPNICQFLGCALDPPTYCVVLEYMEGGSLYEYLRRPNGQVDFFVTANSVARGMEYLHEHCQMLHRDLKSPNLLMDASGKAKIADFGLTCLADTGVEKTAEIGTYRWMAPEVISHEDYGFPADVYSYGIILYEILTRELPFSGVSPMKVALSVSGEGLRPTLPPTTPESISALISDCWHQEPSRRPTFKQVITRLELAELQISPREKLAISEIALNASHLKPKSKK
jgi:tRNA A-37 threonylcarbamoyl transferase component Bud32